MCQAVCGKKLSSVQPKSAKVSFFFRLLPSGVTTGGCSHQPSAGPPPWHPWIHSLVLLSSSCLAAPYSTAFVRYPLFLRCTFVSTLLKLPFWHISDSVHPGPSNEDCFQLHPHGPQKGESCLISKQPDVPVTAAASLPGCGYKKKINNRWIMLMVSKEPGATSKETRSELQGEGTSVSNHPSLSEPKQTWWTTAKADTAVESKS